MDVSRRTFLRTTVIGGAGVTVFGFSLAPVYAQTQGLKIARTTETRSTCPYCSVSCGVIINTLGDKAKNAIPQVVHVEGDPDHPINRGTLCPKGASLLQDIVRSNTTGGSSSRRCAAPAAPDGKTSPGMKRSAKSPPKSRRPATTLSSRKTPRVVPRIASRQLAGSEAAPTPTS